jgi:hypothetical protein
VARYATDSLYYYEKGFIDHYELLRLLRNMISGDMTLDLDNPTELNLNDDI